MVVVDPGAPVLGDASTSERIVRFAVIAGGVVDVMRTSDPSPRAGSSRSAGRPVGSSGLTPMGTPAGPAGASAVSYLAKSLL
jgi:hypothetical protein